MSEQEPFRIVGDRVDFCLTGETTLAVAVAAVTAAIRFARDNRIPKLMVDSRELTGFTPPGIHVRYFFVQEWALAAGGKVVIAMIARREMIDPHKFGVVVAANRGLAGDVFETEEEAVAWLEARG